MRDFSREVMRKCSLIMRVVLVILMGILVWAETSAAAEGTNSGAVDNYGLDGSNWMSRINDNRLLSEINLPGTHDSSTASVDTYGTFSPWFASYAVCQDLYIDDQLNAGIRYLDLRLSDVRGDYNDGRSLWLAHGNWQAAGIDGRFFCKDRNGEYLTLEMVLQKIIGFLKEHPTETVVINLSRETGAEDVEKEELNRSIYQRIREHLRYPYEQKNPYTKPQPYKRYLYTEDGKFGCFSRMPTLGECRGQMVVISENPNAAGAGSNYSFPGYGSSSVDAGCGKPVGNIAGMTFFYENHYEDKKDKKREWVQKIFEEFSGENIPTDEETHLGYGLLVQTSANVWASQNPKEIANTVNPVIYPKGEPFFKKGKFYGWVLSDFVDANMAKAIWSTNYPEKMNHAHNDKLTRKQGSPATCTEQGRKTYYHCKEKECGRSLLRIS